MQKLNLPTNIVKSPMFFFDSLPSTNDKLRDLCASNLPEGSAVVAFSQEKGRGQLGAVWESEAGKNITLSIAFRPIFLPIEQMFYLSKIVAISIHHFLQEQGISSQIKWPNDILVNEKKICGVLIEQQICKKNISLSIIGIGLNLNQERFMHAPNATSLFLEDAKKRAIKTTAMSLKNCVLKDYMALKNNFSSMEYRKKIDARYFQYLYRNKGIFDFGKDGKRFRASIVDVSQNGELSLQLTSGRIEKFYFKEVDFL
ncbi:MAG: biotin--[acetyl-CoA-carboxylase] ligase [Bacteroidales bacterium]